MVGYGYGASGPCTYTRTRFLQTRVISIYNPFSSPIRVLKGADFSGFKWVRVLLPSLLVCYGFVKLLLFWKKLEKKVAKLGLTSY